jgi:SMC interacting uncharacterized protein involved in chromosome segregation
MTKFGFVFFSFILAIVLATFSIFVGFRDKNIVIREESPKVRIIAPLKSKILKFAEEFQRAKALYELLNASLGKYNGKWIEVPDFENSILEAKKLSKEIEVIEIEGEKLIRVKDYKLVVIGR